MITSFWKSYWFNMVIGIICLIVAIVFMFVEEADFTALSYLVASFIWISGAHIGYNRDRINALAQRVADLEKELYKE